MHSQLSNTGTVSNTEGDFRSNLEALTRASISSPSPSTNNLGLSGVSNTISMNNISLSPTNNAFEWGTPLFDSTRPGLALRLSSMLLCKIFPSASRLNIEAFRSQYRRVEINILFKKYGSVLRRLFSKYAKSQSTIDDEPNSNNVWGSTIDFKEIIQLLRDSKILDGKYVTLQQVYSILANVRPDFRILKDNNATTNNIYIDSQISSLPNKTTNKKRSSIRSSGASELSKFLPTNNAPLSPNLSPSNSIVNSSSNHSTNNPNSSITSSNANNIDSDSLTLDQLDFEKQAAMLSKVPLSVEELQNRLEANDLISSHTVLTYPEFLEALAAIAASRHPNPFKPVYLRLQQFLERDLLPWCAFSFNMYIQY
jgi:hypothetical protein